MIDLKATQKQFIVVDETDTVRMVRDRVRDAGKAWTYIVVRRHDCRYAVFRLSELIVLLHRENVAVSFPMLETRLAEVAGLLDASAHEAIRADSMSLERANEKAHTTPGRRLVLVLDGHVVGVLADDTRSTLVDITWLDDPPPPVVASNHPTKAMPPAGDPAFVEEAIRLDVATSPIAEVEKSFDLAVRISPPGSEPLAEEGLTKLASRLGRIFWASGQWLVHYRVRVSAAACDVQPDHQDFLLRASQVSDVLFFQLTPHRDGEMSIVVTAQQEDEMVAASTRVVLIVGLTAQTAALLPDDVMVKLYDTLRTRFNLDDLEDLCFHMAIVWDDIEGATLSAKSRALIDWCLKRGLVAHLVQTAKVARPDLAI